MVRSGLVGRLRGRGGDEMVSTHRRREEGRRRRPEEQLLELPLHVLHALALAVLRRALAHGVQDISQDLAGALPDRNGEGSALSWGGHENISELWQICGVVLCGCVRHRRRRCRRPRRHTGSACWGPTALLKKIQLKTIEVSLFLPLLSYEFYFFKNYPTFKHQQRPQLNDEGGGNVVEY